MTDATHGEDRAEIEISSGRLSILRFGPAKGPLVICVPGLSQDERSLEVLGRGIATARRRVVAVSLRGRGRSDATGSGTYGLPAHARDLLELATMLGAPQFDLVGWSMGGLVGMQLAVTEASRLKRLVLLDIAGKPEPKAIDVIAAGIQRLGAVYASPEAYLARVMSSGIVDTCRDVWADYLAGDLVAVEGGFTSRTSREAVIEDATFNSRIDPYVLWKSLSMPVLLLRATVPITRNGGFLVTPADAARFSTEVAAGQVVEVPANHYCMACAGPSVLATREFLDA